MAPRTSGKGYTSAPLTFNRKMVGASARVSRIPAIHCVTEIDVTLARQRIREIHDGGATKLSFTAYLVRCLALVLQDHPALNSFIRRGRLYLLEDSTISVLVERDFGPEKTPEPLAIRAVQKKSLGEVHTEIRQAQKEKGDRLGSLSGSTWIRFIPGFLLRFFVRMASTNIALARRYGKVAVTAVGMFSRSATWFIPHGSATVLLTVGSVSIKQVWNGEEFEPREMLHLTASFDHRVVDGAPAARFMKQFSDRVEDAEELNEADG